MKLSKLKIREKILIFFVVRIVVILYGCQESVGKLKKKESFRFVFTMKPSRLKIMEKVFIFLWFNLL